VNTPNPDLARQQSLVTKLANLLLALLLIGLVLYLGIVLISYLTNSFPNFHSAVSKGEALTIGLPCAAVGAFGVVALLLHIFPPEKQQSGAVTIKLFGAVFTGPAGPTTLWLICFLAFLLAIKTLR
jgi:hypothetical protein